MKFNFTNSIKGCDKESKGCLVLGQFGEEGGNFPKALEDMLAKSVSTYQFKGEKLTTIDCANTAEASSAGDLASFGRIIVAGLGAKDKLNNNTFVELGAKIAQKLKKSGVTDLTICPSDDLGFDAAANIALGFKMGDWEFDYKTKDKKESTDSLQTVTIVTKQPAEAEAAFGSLDAVAEGVALTRTLVTMPPNKLYPETMADQAQQLKDLGVVVEVLDKEQMQKLGMGALLGVAQGSSFDPRLIVLQWKNGPADQAPVAIVGKGVTFDSGGISIKPANDMEQMKDDMAGSGVVIGLIKALALRKAKVNVVGVMGMVENMPSGTAQRPADVVTSMSGQTIEVINTDAEGRLVLADALWYTQDRFKPQAMIDLATLTGAMRVALGEEHAGLFSNDKSLTKALVDAGKDVNELLWAMPLSPVGEGYDKDMNCDIADMRNTAAGGRGGGSITAAQFLQRFVNNVPWAHLDIAAVAAYLKRPHPVTGKFATGFGVRLLDSYIKTNYEK